MRILLTGATGRLGRYITRGLVQTNHETRAWVRKEPEVSLGISTTLVDLGNLGEIDRAFQDFLPNIVLHCAAMSAVADCFAQPEVASRINIGSTKKLCELANHYNSRMIFTSTDMVFDGSKGNYREQDPVCPLSHYGWTKAEAEKEVLRFSNNLVVRLSLLHGSVLTGSKPSFHDGLVNRLHNRQPVACFSDEFRTPLDLQTASSALIVLLNKAVQGILHLGGPERMSRLEMGQRVARQLGLPTDLLQDKSRESAPGSEPRPADLSLNCDRFRELFPDFGLPTIEEALLGEDRIANQKGKLEGN